MTDDAERKRLERLNQSSSQSIKPKEEVKPKTPTPKPELVVPLSSPKITRPAKTSDLMEIDQPTVNKAKVTPPKQSNPVEAFCSITDEDWVEALIKTHLNVTIDRNETTRVFLEKTHMEFIRDNVSMKLNSDHFEKVLFDRLSMQENTRFDWEASFDYMVKNWNKLQITIDQLQSFSGINKEANVILDRRLSIAEHFASLMMNYIGLLINQDCIELFPKNHNLESGYMGWSMASNENFQELYTRRFIDAFIQKYRNDDLFSYFNYTCKMIWGCMKKQSFCSGYLGPLCAFKYLQSFPEFQPMFCKLDIFLPNYITPSSIEIQSILGPFFARTAALPDSDSEVGSKYFGVSRELGDAVFDSENNPNGGRNQSDIKLGKNVISDIMYSIRTELHDIVLGLIKACPESKDITIKYFETLVNMNLKRGMVHYNHKEVATDGYMINTTEVLKRLCSPIMESSYTKIDLIDSNYFLGFDKLDISEQTRINCDLETAKQMAKTFREENPNRPEPNFVTNIFYLTLAYHNYGILPCMRRLGEFRREIEEMQRMGARSLSQRDNAAFWNSRSPQEQQQVNIGIQNLQKKIEDLIGHRLAFECGLTDPNVLNESIRFYNLVITWLVKLATGTAKKGLSWKSIISGDAQGLPIFPLPETPSSQFASLPEWILENVCDFFLFAMRHAHKNVANNSLTEFVTFGTMVLANPGYIKNPYVKSKIVEILFMFTVPQFVYPDGSTNGRLDAVLTSNPYSRAHLTRAILRFYVDAEQTGASSQFYDKFNIRHNISHIFKSMLGDYTQHDVVVQFIKDDPEFFTKFAALMNNDTTYLLDESLGKLKEIARLQNILEVPLAADASEQQRQLNNEQQNTLFSHERHVQTYLVLAAETVQFMHKITHRPEVIQQFMAPEIVFRVAAMLDYNLVALAGPKSSELKVKNREKYRFDPKQLLSHIVGVFVNFSQRKEFIDAVAKDGRSYDKKVFETALGIVQHHNLISVDNIERFSKFIEKVEEIARADTLEEEDLGEVPDEFLDPLLFTLMVNPVKLPSSEVVIDLSTIRTHLLSDPHDPFNRQPLKLEDVIPDVELQEKIQSWKKLQMSEKSANK